MLRFVYFAYFHSNLSYGLEIWGRAPDYLTQRVFKLQKRAIRLISGVAPRESCRPLFKQLNILPLPALYIYKVLLFARKNPHYFEHCKKQHPYHTRHKDLFVYESHNSAKYERGLLYSAEQFYNNLPEDIRQIMELHSYKISLKSYLLSLDIYSINDYFNLSSYNKL